MTRLAAIFFISFALLCSAQAAHAQSEAPLTLSLVRAVRISTTALTLSFKTSESAVAQVTYTLVDGSKIQLTDSAAQVDHLFTVTELNPARGYTFALSATAGPRTSNNYMVLLSPDSIGANGQSIVPAYQITTPSGEMVATSVAASTTPSIQKTFLPWWVFAILFVLVIGGWTLKSRYDRSHPVVRPDTLA